MKKILLSLGIMLIGIVFCAGPCYAACTLDPENGPYATVKRYQSGKNKVIEMWECVVGLERFNGNGVCLTNQLSDLYDFQVICISGEFRIELPVNWDTSDFFY